MRKVETDTSLAFQNRICSFATGDIYYISILVHFYFLVVWGPFGLRSGQFRTKFFGANNSKFQNFSICAAVAAAAGAH